MTVERTPRSITHVNDCSLVAATLVAELQKRGWSARLVQPPRRAYRGTADRRWSTTQNPIYFALNRLALGLRFRIAAGSRDVLHIHYGMFGVIGVLSGKPYVLHFHGSDLLHDGKKWTWAALHRLAARRASVCLVSTPDLLLFEREVGAALTFIPNPVDIPPSPATHDDGSILFASKLDINKAPSIALPAAEELARRGMDVRVLGFGSAAASHVDDLKRIEDLGGVVIRERLSERDFEQLLSVATVIVGQFGVGALGMTELRAMALGKPVVAKFAFDDVYSAPPPLARAASSAQIVDAVERLIGDRQYGAALGRDARMWVALTHATGRVVESIELLYTRAI